MRISGGAQAAIDDLRTAGIYVSPAEESASKILEMANNNPFADALTAMLDGGNPVLQKQALRVRRKTARLLCPTGQATLRWANT